MNKVISFSSTAIQVIYLLYFLTSGQANPTKTDSPKLLLGKKLYQYKVTEELSLSEGSSKIDTSKFKSYTGFWGSCLKVETGSEAKSGPVTDVGVNDFPNNTDGNIRRYHKHVLRQCAVDVYHDC